MDYQHLILRILLSKYEENPHFLQEVMGGRRIALHLGKSGRDLAAYAAASPSEMEKIHAVVQKLADMKLVSFAWEPFSRSKILATIWLNQDPRQIAQSYALIGIKPQNEITADVQAKLEAVIDTLTRQTSAGRHREWILAALREIAGNISQNEHLSPWLPENHEHAAGLLQVLQALAQDDFVEMNVTAFSIWLFGDARFFEQNVQKNLQMFILRFEPKAVKFAFDQNDEELLSTVGLFRTSEMIEFCGPLLLTAAGQNFDFGVFAQGSSLKATAVESIESIDASRIKSLLFVESRAIYDQLLRSGLEDGELIFLNGGLHSSRKNHLIRQIASTLPSDIPIAYWGDIDIASLTQYLMLAQLIGRPLQTQRMDRETLLAMSAKATKFSETYRNQLIKVRGDDFFQPLGDLIDCMLETGLRLNQEVFLPTRESPDRHR